MNYRHGFHAGNHADVLKHAVFQFCLDSLRRKPSAFGVLDTHAGRGLYDLASEEARVSPEWREGIGRLWSLAQPPPLVSRYVSVVRSFNASGELRLYPGSPAIATVALREDDVLAACELHPEEHAALRRALPRKANVQVHARDGWEALTALLPPEQRRGLVLIDPPYEHPDELRRAARALGPALKRFGHGIYLWWRPLKSSSDLDAADGEARAQGARKTVRADLWIAQPAPEGRLVGSSLFVINPPFGLQETLRETLPFLAESLSQGESGWRIAPAE